MLLHDAPGNASVSKDTIHDQRMGEWYMLEVHGERATRVFNRHDFDAGEGKDEEDNVHGLHG